MGSDTDQRGDACGGGYGNYGVYVDDPELDGPIAFTVVTAPAVSADPEYSGLDAADVAGINLDNEVGPDPQRHSRPRRHLPRRP